MSIPYPRAKTRSSNRKYMQFELIGRRWFSLASKYLDWPVRIQKITSILDRSLSSNSVTVVILRTHFPSGSQNAKSKSEVLGVDGSGSHSRRVQLRNRGCPLRE
ncbi:hypothetical protein Zmor_003322 [Zophobas morio]|uniref:Uncharacterized protein n=1 Tax=Zophobas morio TaxID=2755281 RepID=A0AA38M1E8_9CUCU|nr:hypothetical protein Zmor_003322 [Zophobas morio]